eukprot:Gb_36400 [translate_table: standard]
MVKCMCAKCHSACDCEVYAWKLPGVAGNSWNSEPGHSIKIGSGCIWGKFIFLATRRPRDCMEMLLEFLRNPRCRLGIVTAVEDRRLADLLSGVKITAILKGNEINGIQCLAIGPGLAWGQESHL